MKKKKALVINIDAHLDVRATVTGPNSGTAFFQLLEEFNNFDFVQVGIQPQANSLHHLDYAKKQGLKIYSYLETVGQIGKVFRSIAANKKWAHSPVFLSIDLDAFSSAYAPGVSAASPIGLDANEFLRTMPYICKALDIHGLGLYEVSPPLDVHHSTSKLAAHILHSYLFHA